ncbi:MAG: hypothetical protein ACFFCY_01760 [Promethearchaeota archaeon]
MFYSHGSFLYTPRHDKRTFVPTENVGFSDGKPSICGGSGPQYVITNIGYLDFEENSKRIRLSSIHPGINIDQVNESTGFELIIPNNLKETHPPTEKELKLLREKVDPLKIRKLEVLAGKDREELIKTIIQKELELKCKYPKLLS